MEKNNRGEWVSQTAEGPRGVNCSDLKPELRLRQRFTLKMSLTLKMTWRWAGGQGPFWRILHHIQATDGAHPEAERAVDTWAPLGPRLWRTPTSSIVGLKGRTMAAILVGNTCFVKGAFNSRYICSPGSVFAVAVTLITKPRPAFRAEQYFSRYHQRKELCWVVRCHYGQSHPRKALVNLCGAITPIKVTAWKQDLFLNTVRWESHSWFHTLNTVRWESQSWFHTL